MTSRCAKISSASREAEPAGIRDGEEPGDQHAHRAVQMAFRMQTSVPELTDLSKEPERTFELYGPDSKRQGTYARNCLMARRLAERGVRFIQIYHRAWDHHGGLPRAIREAANETDQANAALIQDLKERGLLDDTLVIWAGEFGRTVYSQGKLTADDYGRDHHPRAFTVWMAGGGVKAGATVGATDDFSYNIAEDPVHLHDLNATILRCLGIDHLRLTYKFQGRYFRLTDTEGKVVKKALNFDPTEPVEQAGLSAPVSRHGEENIHERTVRPSTVLAFGRNLFFGRSVSHPIDPGSGSRTGSGKRIAISKRREESPG